MRRFVFVCAAVLVLVVVAACGDGPPDHADECEQGGIGGPGCSPTPTIDDSCEPSRYFGYEPTITFGDSSLFVEIADDGTERSRGLMNRACLRGDWGMLLVYPRDVENTFWMKDTLIPLSIAWLKADGTILAIADMQPQTEDPHSASAPYR